MHRDQRHVGDDVLVCERGVPHLMHNARHFDSGKGVDGKLYVLPPRLRRRCPLRKPKHVCASRKDVGDAKQFRLVETGGHRLADFDVWGDHNPVNRRVNRRATEGLMSTITRSTEDS